MRERTLAPISADRAPQASAFRPLAARSYSAASGSLHKAQLGNGVTVISDDQSASPVATISVVVKAGSGYETHETHGAGHFLKFLALKVRDLPLLFLFPCFLMLSQYPLLAAPPSSSLLSSLFCLLTSLLSPPPPRAALSLSLVRYLLSLSVSHSLPTSFEEPKATAVQCRSRGALYARMIFSGLLG